MARSRLGPYELILHLGAGGMGEVVIGRRTGAAGFAKLVAIKRLLLPGDADMVRMFLREARVTARMSHPNVCQAFELLEAESGPALVMEYLEGVPFSRLVRDLPRSAPAGADLRLIAAIAAMACDGLHYAHELDNDHGQPLGLIHRDVTPGNLFVTVEGSVKVLDFGIVTESLVATARATSNKGTRAYMSPEQVSGQRLDRRSDIFSLGVVIHELVTGRALFSRASDLHLVQSIVSGDIPRVSELVSGVPPAFDDAIARALMRSPDDRWPTARAFGAALRGAVQTLGGPLDAASIADEIERLFGGELHKRRAFIAATADRSVDERELASPPDGDVTRDLTASVPSLAANSPSLAAARPSTQVTVPLSSSIEPAPERRRRAAWVIVGGAALVATVGVVGIVLWPSRGAPVAPPDDRTALIARDDARAQGSALVAAPDSHAEQGSGQALANMPVEQGSGQPVVGPPSASSSPPRPVGGNKRPRVPAASSGTSRNTSSNTSNNTPGNTSTNTTSGGANVTPGHLTLDSEPYASITIDGISVGDTPLARISLAPGRHRIDASCSCGQRKSITLDIASGADERRLLTWEAKR